MPSLPGACLRLCFVLLVFASAAGAQQSLAISHDSLECWPTDRYPIVGAALTPPQEVRAARVYFRSEEYPDFYYVDALLQADGRFEAVLPLAAPGTERVVYYIEAVTLAFESNRTREWTPIVADSDECRRRDPLLALFQGEIPDIVVGALRAGAPLLPPGFQAAGIVGGGGISAVTIGAIVAGGAAGGVVLGTGGGGETSSVTTSVLAIPPTTSISAGVTTTAPTTTAGPTTSAPPSSSTTTATAGIPTTTTTSIPGIPTTTTSIPGIPTTTTTLSTTTTSAPATSTTTSAPSTTTTTSRVTTTTSVPPPTTTTAPAGADVWVDISGPLWSSLLSVIRYQVVVQNDGPLQATGVRLTVSLPLSVTFQSASSGSCRGLLGAVQCDFGTLAAGGSASVDLTVLVVALGSVTTTASVTANEADPNPGNNSDSVTTNIRLLLRDSPGGFVSVIAHLDFEPRDGRDRGEVIVDSILAGMDGTAPLELRASGVPGEYVIEAVLVASSGRRGRWRFELRSPPGVEVSGITADAGEVLALEPRRVIFALRGEVGERLRFRYRVSAP